MTQYKLVIAEKPSVAQSIAKVLGVRNHETGIWKETDISSPGVSVI